MQKSFNVVPAVCLCAGIAFQAGAQCELNLVNEPHDLTYCPALPLVYNVSATGEGAIQYQWQWRREGQTTWRNVVTGFNNDFVANFIAEGHQSTQLTVTGYNEGHWSWAALAAEFRCIVTNGCATVESRISSTVVCPADINCDMIIDFFDYLDFVQLFSSRAPQADFNDDGIIDFFDYLDFIVAFSGGCDVP
jgi:hypothetical protein